MPLLFWDIESRSACAIATGAWHYAAGPTTEVTVISYAVDDGDPKIWIPGQPIPEEFFTAASDPSWTVVAHNHEFERAMATCVLHPRFGWPLIPVGRQVCTMVMARAVAMPGALENVAAALELPHQKDADGAKLMKEMCAPRKPLEGEDPNVIHWVDSPEKRERLGQYCATDVQVERALYHRLPPLPPDERRLFALDAEINARGFHTDRALAEAARAIAKAEAAAVNAEIAELTGGEVTSVNQRDRILAFAHRNGHTMTSLGKRNVSAVLAHGPDDALGKLLELRRTGAKSSVAKFNTLLNSVDDDDRLRGTLVFYGSSTGRWSGRGFQPQNLPKTKTADIDGAIAAIMTGDIDRVREIGAPLEVASDVARSIVCAAPGHKLIGGDFSAIESRVLAWIAGEDWKVNAYRQYDATNDPLLEPYCVTASRILRRSVTPDDEAGRGIGKVCDLAFGYGGAAGAFKKFSDSHSDAEIEKFKDDWRAAHPRITRLWRAVDRCTLRAVDGQPIAINDALEFRMEDGTLFITLPSKRRLAYPRARIGPGKFGNDAVYYHDNARGGWAEIETWYGTFVENIVQATARDLLAAAMLRLDSAGYKIVLHVHDEIMCEVPEDFGSESEFLKLMLELPPWATGLPIAAKTWSSKRYTKSSAKAPEENDMESEPRIGSASIVPELVAILESYGALVVDVVHVRAPAPGSAPSGPDPDRGNGYAGNGRDRSTVTSKTACPECRMGKDTSGDNLNIYGDGHAYCHACKHYIRNYEPTESDDTAASDNREGDALEAEYVYKDRDGRPHTLVQKRKRGEKKSFPQAYWNGTDWAWGKLDRPKIPFRLPELLAAALDVPIWIPEGEKDCNNLAALGLIATTNSEGASRVPRIAGEG